jgi:glycosyltransferase involved in cell wall biosynthesis
MALRRALATLRPDVVISCVDLTNVLVVRATAGLTLPVIVSERIDPGAYTHRLSRIDRALRYLTYPRASWIVVQTKRAARFFDTRQNSKIVTIPNPVPATDLAAQPDRPSPEGRFRIICVGRLDHQKGFDILIESFLRVAHEFPIWDVVIFGEGSDRSALLTQIQAYGLENRVKLMGISRDVASEMVRAHIIAFPSRYEGFPNALAEAMAVGLPAIAFNGVSGVEDLIIDDETGLLIDWDQSKPESPIPPFVDGLRKLMTEAELRMRLGAGGKIRVQQYSPEIILKQWQQLITEAGAIENS